MALRKGFVSTWKKLTRFIFSGATSLSNWSWTEDLSIVVKGFYSICSDFHRIVEGLLFFFYIIWEYRIKWKIVSAKWVKFVVHCAIIAFSVVNEMESESGQDPLIVSYNVN
jgi:hypothetical protein